MDITKIYFLIICWKRSQLKNEKLYQTKCTHV